jgi:acetyltransferase-like isoleucine patch superfamily enzyme
MRFKAAGPPQAVVLVAVGLDRVATLCRLGWRVVRATAQLGRFGSHGNDFWFDPDGTYSHSTIHVGNNVNLGVRPVIVATRSTVRMGDNVMLGPEVTIRGGNHRTDVLGTPMIGVTKDPDDGRFDLGVVIEDDVWIGTRAVILHGVVIGRGAVIGAGAVVTRSVPPYAVAVGNPARVRRRRWSIDAILEHERMLYPPARRLTIDQLAGDDPGLEAEREWQLDPTPPGTG